MGKQELMIRQFCKTLTGKEFDVEVIDDIVVLSIPHRFHIYVLSEGLQLIGVMESADLEWFRALDSMRTTIRRIQNNHREDDK